MYERSHVKVKFGAGVTKRLAIRNPQLAKLFEVGSHGSPSQDSLSFACAVFATLHESSKIFVEHTRHVARI